MKIILIFLGVVAVILPLPSQDTLIYADGTQRIIDLPKPPTSGVFSELGEARATEVSEIRFADGNGRYRAANVEMAKAPDGTRPVLRRFGYLLVDGEWSLTKISLTPQEYDPSVRGSEDYLYVVSNGTDTYQLDLFNYVGGPGSYAVSSRFRNVLEYAVRECEPAARAANAARFTDRSLLGVVSVANRCANSATAYADESKIAAPARNSHGIAISYLYMLSEDTPNRSISGGIAYAGEYGVSQSDRFKIMVGLGIYRLAYRLERLNQVSLFPQDPGVSQGMLRGQLLGAYSPYANGSNSLLLTGGFTIYNKLGSSEGALLKEDDSYGMITVGAGYRVNSLTFALNYQFNGGASRLRPQRIGELAVRYEF